MKTRYTALAITAVLATSACSWIERVNVTSTGEEATDWSSSPSVSGDGRYVAFTSDAYLAPNSRREGNVYVHDTVTKITEVVSLTRAGTNPNNVSFYPSMSANGRHVGFTSWASNLVAGDVGNEHDVFVRNLVTDTTVRVSVNSAGIGANGHSGATPSLSADGRYVAFSSEASNLHPLDTNEDRDVFVHDTQTGTTELAGVTSEGVHPVTSRDSGAQISSDGRFVVFQSTGQLAPEDTSIWFIDVYLRDRIAGTTELVSISSTGAVGNGDSGFPAVSNDGRHILFWSKASNFVANDTNGEGDLFHHDRVTGVTSRVNENNAGVVANGYSDWGGRKSISADGRYAVFFSAADNLVEGDTNGEFDVFVRDLQAKKTRRVSLDLTGKQGNGRSSDNSISEDGRYVAFASDATNLVEGDTNRKTDIFIRALPHPEIVSAFPNMLPAGTTTAVTITGVDFLPGTTIDVVDAQVSNLQVVNETTITADITVPAGTASGSRHLTVLVNGTGASLSTGSIALCEDCFTFF